MKRKSVSLCFVFLLFVFCSYAEEEQKLPVSTAPDEIVWTPAMLEYTFCGPDPIGGWNRCVFAFNDGLMLYVVRPVSWVYSSILPKPVIDGLWNMCRNLEYPIHLFSCLGSAEWTGAWDETVRFFVNTTVGVAGIFDPAKDWMYYHRTDANFGRMFSKWGIGPGCTFMFPFMSFINVRDGVGAIFDYAFDLRTYVPYSSWVYVNEAVIAENQYNSAMKSTLDNRYHQYRMIMAAKRELQLLMWEYRAMNAGGKIMQEKIPDPGKDILIEEKIAQKEEELFSPLKADGNVTQLFGFPNDTALSGQPYLDSLYSILFTPEADHHSWYLRRSLFNQDFISRGERRKLKSEKENGELPFEYYFWDVEQEQPKDRLLIILPGIGALADNNSVLAMAELFSKRGWQTISLNSTFTPQFMLSDAGGCVLPGYPPRDAANMRAALQRVLADLRKEKKIAEKQWITLLGWSFGGLHTLHIAALEDQQNTLNVSRFVSLNPPAELDYALAQADKLALTSKGWSKEKALDTIARAFGAAFISAQENSITLYNPRIKDTRDARYLYLRHATQEQAKILISLSINSSLRDVLLSYHLRKPLPGLVDTAPENRQMLDLQLDMTSYRQYADKMIEIDPSLPRTYEEMARNSGLKAIESTLRNNPKIRVFHTFNDFLISNSQRRFLQNALGQRMFWFDRGGHLGYWFEKLAQEVIYRQSMPENAAGIR